MRKTCFAALILLCTVLLLAGCGAGKTDTPAIAVSEAYGQAEADALEEGAAAPLPAVDLTPEPEVMKEYQVGSVVLTLPDEFSVQQSYDGGFMLTGSTAIISGDWYDEERFSYIGAAYPPTPEEMVSILMPQGREILGASTENGRAVVEYVEEGETTRWACYSVYDRGESVCWKVEFLCPDSVYEQMKPSFIEWADSMVLPDAAEEAGKHEMTSVSGLFTLQLPGDCIVIDDTVTAESLALFGMQGEDAQAFLEEAQSRGAGQDVIGRTDFGAMLTVSVLPDTGMTQGQMLEQDMYIDEALAGEDYTYEGVVTVDDNPNPFYFVRIDHGDYEELGFTTYHDDAGASITFSFTGFSEDEAREILKTLNMLTRSD